MKSASLMPRIPVSAWVWFAAAVIAMCCLWSILLAQGLSSDWVVWGCALLAAVVFVGFGLAVWCLLVLVPRLHRPAWLDRRQALALSAACFVMQSATAGVMTLLGAWPHPERWFLGALPFAFGG